MLNQTSNPFILFLQLRSVPKLLRQASSVRWFSEDVQSSIVKEDGKQSIMVRHVCYFVSGLYQLLTRAYLELHNVIGYKSEV